MYWNYINKVGVISLIIILISCTPAPRYNTKIKKTINFGKNTSKIENKNKNKNDNKKPINSNKKKSNIKFDIDKKKYKGLSSYYGKKFHGKLTANGEIFDMYGLTAAHKTFPLNTICRVTNLANQKSLILRINDRGPYVGDRILDCSYGAAKKLDFITQGVTEVEIEIMEWGDDIYMHHDRH